MARADVAQRGFTLIEVVVAIAIVALGMMAVFRVVHDTVNNSTYLRDRTFATWIADNRLAEIRLAAGLPSVDETEGDVEFAGQKWHWRATVSQTPVDDLRRIDVRVRRADDAPDSSLAEVSGFAGAVAMDSPPSATPWTRAGQPSDGTDGDGQGDGSGSAGGNDPARPRGDSPDDDP
jgi:general secretion pathway protein I